MQGFSWVRVQRTMEFAVVRAKAVVVVALAWFQRILQSTLIHDECRAILGEAACTNVAAGKSRFYGCQRGLIHCAEGRSNVGEG